MADVRAASVQFLTFLADIYAAETGEVQMDRLAAWLGLTEDELSERRYQSGKWSWKDFADEILAILDLMQDCTRDLARTLAWYRHDPIASCAATADDMVARGRAQEVIALLGSQARGRVAPILMVQRAHRCGLL